MRINNVHIFIAPNFGVKQALRSALHRAVKHEVKITHFEVDSNHWRATTAIFNAEYETGTLGNKVVKKLVGTIFHHSQLDSVGEFVLPCIDIDFEEIA